MNPTNDPMAPSPSRSHPPTRSPSPHRRILLLDCDQFFVQCARIADPEGAGREPLLLVGGSPERRGVVTSASYETRKYGARSGMPMARALRLCPQAKVVPVPRELCGIKSREVRAVLARFSPVVEAASIDEAYLDMTGTEALYDDAPLEEVARRIQAAVREETGIAVSLGGGTNRLIAKLASGLAKPAGVHVVPAGEEAAFMRRFTLRDLPGVGPALADTLQRLGLATVEHALERDEAWMIRNLGERRGAWLYRRIRGIDSTPVEPYVEPKSMSREETFPEDIHDDDALETELFALATRVGADLRREGRRARTVTVKLRDADFRTRQASRTVPEPLESDRAILAVARELLARLRAERRTGARLLGVSLSQFGGPTGGQLALFEEEAESLETDRDRALSRTMGDLTAHFGPDAVRSRRLLDR